MSDTSEHTTNTEALSIDAGFRPLTRPERRTLWLKEYGKQDFALQALVRLVEQRVLEISVMFQIHGLIIFGVLVHTCSRHRVRMFAVTSCGKKEQKMRSLSLRDGSLFLFFRKRSVQQYVPDVMSKYVLVSTETYAQFYIDQFEEMYREQEPAAADLLRDYYTAQVPSPDEFKIGPEGLPFMFHYAHLRDVTIMSADHKIKLPYWRGKISEIDAFAVGATAGE